MHLSQPPGPDDDRPEVGVLVEIWSTFLSRWVDGFELVGSSVDGCVVRRRSDRAVLGLPLPPHRVREVRR